MGLNKKQAEAVNYIDGPLLVLAGPGTGKTHLLSARVEHILKATDVSPENILCITFTESGASNMRERLLSTIGKEARKLQIHTYHAFGVDLLSQYKNFADKFDRNLDSAIDEVTKYKIVKTIQEDLPVQDILKHSALRDILDTISSAKQARLSGEDLVKVAEKNEALSVELNSEISPILEGAKKGARYPEVVDDVYRPILEILVKYVSKEKIVRDIEPVSNVLARDLARLIREAEDLDANGKKVSVKPFSDWKKACFECKDDGGYRLKDRVANKKLKSLGKIMIKYSELLEKDGLYDFDDMIEQAISFLKKDEAFRLTCQERYQYILLDEFQDTNPSQAEIIRLLTDYEKPNVMAVGDDDQAIFEFQGADASNLLNFEQYYGAKVVNLEENYRSNQEILDFSRKIADQISNSFVKNEGAKEMGLSKKLTAFKGPGGIISRHEFLTSDQEYQFVADEISKLIKQGVPQKEIAIIAPKHKYIAPLLPFLKEKENLNIAYEKRDNIFEDPRLSEILILSRFIYDLSLGKNISSRLLEIMSFPFWQIPSAEAISAVYQAKEDKKSGLDYLLKSSSPKIRELAEFLAKLTMLSFDTPLELMLDYMVGSVELEISVETRAFRSPFLEFYAKEQDSFETFELYENLAVLREAILSYSKEKTLRLKDLVLLLEDYEEAGMGLVNTSPYRDSEDAVQLVTAHKSKGLEYEYVFLIATDNVNWGRGKGNNNLLSLPKNMVQIRHTGTTDDEKLRLLFVAITRAKKALVMTNSTKDFSGKSPARLSYLEEYVDDDGNVISPLIINPKNSEKLYKVSLHYNDLKELRKTVDLRKTWRSAYVRNTPELRPILLRRMENYKLTSTDLASFVDISYGGPMAFFEKKVLRTPQPPATSNIILGNLVHHAFQKITADGISDEEAVEGLRKEAECSDLTGRELKELLEIGELALRTSLESFGDLLRAQNSRAELDLKGEHITIDGVPVTGVLDHVAIEKEKKTIEIYDFKTGKYHKEKWGSVNSLYKYSLQLGFYKLILNNSPTYKLYKVTKGHILFVNPDEEGKVYDKVLDFEEFERTDEKTLKQLISVVYKQATSLEFLDDDELRVEADKNKTMKDVKNFIKLLIEKTSA